MTDFVDAITERVDQGSVLALSEWDGRTTSALVRRAERDELLWLLWDFAPFFEVWLQADLNSVQGKTLRADGAQDIAGVLASHPTSATLTVFDPGPDAPRPDLLQVHWKTTRNPYALALAAVQDLVSEARQRVPEHADDPIGRKLSEVVATLSALQPSPA